jgi:hypothetical protein
MKNKIYVKHILEKHFGKKNPKVEYAMIELEQLANDPLDKIVDEPAKEYKPAYEDATPENLHNGCCHFCRMVWYNCLCSHDDE